MRVKNMQRESFICVLNYERFVGFEKKEKKGQNRI